MADEDRPKSSTVYTPGKDQQFIWSMVDKVVDGTKAVTAPVASGISSGVNAVVLPETHKNRVPLDSGKQ